VKHLKEPFSVEPSLPGKHFQGEANTFSFWPFLFHNDFFFVQKEELKDKNIDWREDETQETSKDQYGKLF